MFITAQYGQPPPEIAGDMVCHTLKGWFQLYFPSSLPPSLPSCHRVACLASPLAPSLEVPCLQIAHVHCINSAHVQFRKWGRDAGMVTVFVDVVFSGGAFVATDRLIGSCPMCDSFIKAGMFGKNPQQDK